MNAGKSTVLLQSNFNYKERGMDTLIYTSSFDDRYGVGKVTSRIGLSADAKIINKDLNLFIDIHHELQSYNKISCILIDEAQFLSKDHVLQLCQVVDKLNIPVLCYGIRTDFQGEPFEGSLYLLALADNLVEIKTVCHCGRKATMVIRVDVAGNKVTDGPKIQIGGNDLYVATCRKHFYD